MKDAYYQKLTKIIYHSKRDREELPLSCSSFEEGIVVAFEEGIRIARNIYRVHNKKQKERKKVEDMINLDYEINRYKRKCERKLNGTDL